MSTLSPFIKNLHQQLTEKQTKQAAWQVIEEYFDFFGLEHLDAELWMLTIGLITNDEMEQSKKARDKLNTFFFYEFTKVFWEAVHVLNERHLGKKAVSVELEL